MARIAAKRLESNRLPAVMRQYLSKLIPVKAGDDVTKVASASRMNAIMEMLRALARGENIKTGPNMTRGGNDCEISIDANPRGGRTRSLILGFTVMAGSASDKVVISKSFLTGITFSLVYPTINGTSMAVTPYPELSIVPEEENLIAIKLEMNPGTHQITNGDFYVIREGAGSLVSATIDRFSDIAEMNEWGRLPEIESDTGAVTESARYPLPIGAVHDDGSIDNDGFLYGPIGIRMGASGAIEARSPALCNISQT